MLREKNADSLHWSDKTWSVLHARQLEASEDRLAAWPKCCPFTTRDEHMADALWQLSYLREDQPLCKSIPDLSALRKRVLSELPDEALLLTGDEARLVCMMLESGGTVELLDMEDIAVAESLLRRLWCWLEWLEDDRLLLHLPMQLMPALAAVYSQPEMQQQAARLYQLYAALHAVLYLQGSVLARDVTERLHSFVPQLAADRFAPLARRWFKAGFDYSYSRDGQMLLIHPGLAEPEHLPVVPALNEALLDLEPEAFFSSVPGILPEEVPIFTLVRGLLDEAVRPELTAEEAAEDLMILAKQNVPELVMQEVLASMLTVQPTPAMRSAVRLVFRDTLRWPGFSPPVLH